MPTTEQSPLLGNGASPDRTRHSFGTRVTDFVTGRGQPGLFTSYGHFIFGSWFNILLLFIPISGVAHYLNWDAGLRFVFSFLAIMPLAKVRFPSIVRVPVP